MKDSEFGWPLKRTGKDMKSGMVQLPEEWVLELEQSLDLHTDSQLYRRMKAS